MAISEQLQQRINNLTQGMGATSNKEMEMLKDASPSNMQFDVEIDGKNRQFGFDSQPDEQAMQMLRDRLGVTKGAISNKEMEMFRDASPSSLIQLSNGQDIQVVRENDPSINQFIEAGYRMVPSPSTSINVGTTCLLYTSPSPRDGLLSRMPSSA